MGEQSYEVAVALAARREGAPEHPGKTAAQPVDTRKALREAALIQSLLCNRLSA